MRLKNCQTREINNLLIEMEENRKDISNAFMSLSNYFSKIDEIHENVKIHTSSEVELLKSFFESYHEILVKVVKVLRDWNYENSESSLEP